MWVTHRCHLGTGLTGNVSEKSEVKGQAIFFLYNRLSEISLIFSNLPTLKCTILWLNNLVTDAQPMSQSTQNIFISPRRNHILLSTHSSFRTRGFAASFPVWIPFISFSCLIALAKNSGIMLSHSSKSRLPHCVCDLGGKAFSLS